MNNLDEDSWVWRFATGYRQVPAKYLDGARARTVVEVQKGWHQEGKLRHFTVQLRFETEDE
jgi:hypothetical protein